MDFDPLAQMDGFTFADPKAGDGGAGEELELRCWAVPLGFEEEVEAQGGRGGGDEGSPGLGNVAEGEDGFCWEVGEDGLEEFGG